MLLPAKENFCPLQMLANIPAVHMSVYGTSSRPGSFEPTTYRGIEMDYLLCPTFGPPCGHSNAD